MPAVLGAGPQIGDEIFAVGNPLGLVGSLSAGVISGLNRTFTLGARAHAVRDDPVRRRGQPGQLRRARYSTQRSGDRDRDRSRQPGGTDNFAGIGFAVPIGTAGRAAGAPAK